MVVNPIAVIEVREHSSSAQENEGLEVKPIKSIDTIDVGRWRSLYTILILAACIANTFIVTSVPRKDSILYPDYWYEGLICAVVGVSLRDSCIHVMDLFLFTREKCLLTKSYFAKTYLICSMVFVVPYCISYYTWTLYSGYNHPMPFVGIFLLLGDIAINTISFWFLFPVELQFREELKRQSQAYVIWYVWNILQMVSKEILSFVATVDSILQWTFPLLIPIARVTGCWVAEKIIDTFSKTCNEDAKFLVTAAITIDYTVFVTTKLYTLQQSTVYGILIVETLLHMKGCHEIFKLNKKIREKCQSAEENGNIANRRKKVQTLVLNEFVETIVPFVFGIAFTMAYYGPNASLFKGLRNDYFGGEVVEDVHRVYTVMILMFCFDFLAMVMSGTILWLFCKIDLFQAFCNLMGKYWMIFLIKLPCIAMNFGARDLNFGFDYSGKFLWITQEGRFNIICNAVHISDEEKSLLIANSTLC